MLHQVPVELLEVPEEFLHAPGELAVAELQGVDRAGPHLPGRKAGQQGPPGLPVPTASPSPAGVPCAELGRGCLAPLLWREGQKGGLLRDPGLS